MAVGALWGGNIGGAYPVMEIVLGSQYGSSSLDALFDFRDQAPAQDGRIFVIDPRRKLMMIHDTTVLTSKQILKDLEKLLKASENWKTGSQ